MLLGSWFSILSVALKPHFLCVCVLFSSSLCIVRAHVCSWFINGTSIHYCKFTIYRIKSHIFCFVFVLLPGMVFGLHQKSGSKMEHCISFMDSSTFRFRIELFECKNWYLQCAVAGTIAIAKQYIIRRSQSQLIEFFSEISINRNGNWSYCHLIKDDFFFFFVSFCFRLRFSRRLISYYCY